jgi:hypothetical protein
LFKNKESKSKSAKQQREGEAKGQRSTVNLLLKSIDNSSVSSLLLEVAVKQQRAITLSPALAVRNTPLGNTNTVGRLHASIDNLDVRARVGTSEIKLSHCALGSRGTDGLESTGNIVRVVEGARLSKVGLRANAVDGDAGGDPLLDVGDEAGGFAVGGAVEVVVVDVELSGGVGGASSLKGNADVVLTKNLHEDVLAESAILVESFLKVKF